MTAASVHDCGAPHTVRKIVAATGWEALQAIDLICPFSDASAVTAARDFDAKRHMQVSLNPSKLQRNSPTLGGYRTRTLSCGSWLGPSPEFHGVLGEIELPYLLCGLSISRDIVASLHSNCSGGHERASRHSIDCPKDSDP